MRFLLTELNQPWKLGLGWNVEELHIIVWKRFLNITLLFIIVYCYFSFIDAFITWRKRNRKIVHPTGRLSQFGSLHKMQKTKIWAVNIHCSIVSKTLTRTSGIYAKVYWCSSYCSWFFCHHQTIEYTHSMHCIQRSSCTRLIRYTPYRTHTHTHTLWTMRVHCTHSIRFIGIWIFVVCWCASHDLYRCTEYNVHVYCVHLNIYAARCTLYAVRWTISHKYANSKHIVVSSL